MSTRIASRNNVPPPPPAKNNAGKRRKGTAVANRFDFPASLLPLLLTPDRAGAPAIRTGLPQTVAAPSKSHSAVAPHGKSIRGQTSDSPPSSQANRAGTVSPAGKPNLPGSGGTTPQVRPDETTVGSRSGGLQAPGRAAARPPERESGAAPGKKRPPEHGKPADAPAPGWGLAMILRRVGPTETEPVVCPPGAADSSVRGAPPDPQRKDPAAEKSTPGGKRAPVLSVGTAGQQRNAEGKTEVDRPMQTAGKPAESGGAKRASVAHLPPDIPSSIPKAAGDPSVPGGIQPPPGPGTAPGSVSAEGWIERFAMHLSTLPDGAHTVTIRLSPERLGDLKIEIRIDAGKMDAAFHTDNAEVRGLLLSGEQTLREALGNAGLSLSGFHVASSGDPGQEQRAAAQPESDRRTLPRGRRKHGKAEALPAVPHGGSVRPGSRTDDHWIA